jgi:hypothetical protein
MQRVCPGQGGRAQQLQRDTDVGRIDKLELVERTEGSQIMAPFESVEIGAPGAGCRVTCPCAIRSDALALRAQVGGLVLKVLATRRGSEAHEPARAAPPRLRPLCGGQIHRPYVRSGSATTARLSEASARSMLEEDDGGSNVGDANRSCPSLLPAGWLWPANCGHANYVNKADAGHNPGRMLPRCHAVAGPLGRSVRPTLVGAPPITQS